MDANNFQIAMVLMHLPSAQCSTHAHQSKQQSTNRWRARTGSCEILHRTGTVGLYPILTMELQAVMIIYFMAEQQPSPGKEVSP